MTHKFDSSSFLKTDLTEIWNRMSHELVPHASERGTDREEAVRSLLRRYLPPRFGVSTGFVFDIQGNVSGQTDIIVFDAVESPRIQTAGGKQFFPCGSVVCAGEIKSRLTSTQKAFDALGSIAAVKRLDRSSGDQTLRRSDGGPPNQQLEHLDQVFTFVFVARECLKEETMREALFAHLRDSPRHEWPNVVFAFNQYLLTYACRFGHCPNPMHAWGISVIDSDPLELLAQFLLYVTRAAVATSVTTFSYWDHLHGSTLPSALTHPFDSGSPLEADLPPHMASPIDDLADE